MPFIDDRLARLYDLKIYINANPTTCFMRRLKRDVKKRGDTIETVCIRYFKDVLPMQKKYVEPQKKLGDMIVNGDRPFDVKSLQILRRWERCPTKSFGMTLSLYSRMTSDSSQ